MVSGDFEAKVLSLLIDNDQRIRNAFEASGNGFHEWESKLSYGVVVCIRYSHLLYFGCI